MSTPPPPQYDTVTRMREIIGADASISYVLRQRLVASFTSYVNRNCPVRFVKPEPGFRGIETFRPDDQRIHTADAIHAMQTLAVALLDVPEGTGLPDIVNVIHQLSTALNLNPWHP